MNENILKSITKYIKGLGLNVPKYTINGYYGFADLNLEYSDGIKTITFNANNYDCVTVSKNKKDLYKDEYKD